MDDFLVALQRNRTTILLVYLLSENVCANYGKEIRKVTLCTVNYCMFYLNKLKNHLIKYLDRLFKKKNANTITI